MPGAAAHQLAPLWLQYITQKDVAEGATVSEAWTNDKVLPYPRLPSFLQQHGILSLLLMSMSNPARRPSPHNRVLPSGSDRPMLPSFPTLCRQRRTWRGCIHPFRSNLRVNCVVFFAVFDKVHYKECGAFQLCQSPVLQSTRLCSHSVSRRRDVS